MWHNLHDPTFIRFDTIIKCDRQTDTWRGIYRTSIASCGNEEWFYCSGAVLPRLNWKRYRGYWLNRISQNVEGRHILQTTKYYSKSAQKIILLQIQHKLVLVSYNKYTNCFKKAYRVFDGMFALQL